MFKQFPLLFIVIFVLLLGWVFFIHFLADRGTIQLLSFYQVDKILHMLGGFVVVGAIYKSLRFRTGVSFLFLLAVMTLWEIFEWMVVPDVSDLYRRNYALWRQDTVLDLIIGMVGGVAAFVSYRKR